MVVFRFFEAKYCKNCIFRSEKPEENPALMVKPFKLFLIIAGLIAAVSAISLFFPKEDLKVGKISIRYPSVKQLFNFDSGTNSHEFTLHKELVQLDLLIDSISKASILDTSMLWSDVYLNETTTDTTTYNNIDTDTTSIQSNNKIATTDILKNRLTPIQFPDSTTNALSTFFDALATGKTRSQQVRIMHYGDSQIEGDRITSFLRLRLQSQFGGTGVGLLHGIPHSYQPGAVFQTTSSNWRQILVSDLGHSDVEHRFGLLGGYSAFTQTRRARKGGFNEAWIKLERRGRYTTPARNFTQCKLFYGYAAEPFMVSVAYKGATQDGEMIAPTKKIEAVSWKVPKQEKSIRIDFKGDQSPLIFGISLESPTGIIVDNIALRGSSGTDFTRANNKSLKEALQQVKPKLIILQFGVNIVPHIVDSYSYYENQIYRQIAALKRATPNVSILLIGVSDMSRREGEQYVSYPNIEKIRDAQLNAATRAGAAFWDCYKAMGGQNSMPAWVFAEPALASKDFVHFTLRGANLIAEMFYSALMQKYNEYIAAQENVQSAITNAQTLQPEE